MRKYESEYVKIQKVVSAECDKCGQAGDYGVITEISIDFGYGSDYDMQTWTFDLCDLCISELVYHLKNQPRVSERV